MTALALLLAAVVLLACTVVAASAWRASLSSRASRDVERLVGLARVGGKPRDPAPSIQLPPGYYFADEAPLVPSWIPTTPAASGTAPAGYFHESSINLEAPTVDVAPIESGSFADGGAFGGCD